jgi:hypothetical protein
MTQKALIRACKVILIGFDWQTDKKKTKDIQECKKKQGEQGRRKWPLSWVATLTLLNA